ncbi:hypothetical protein ACU4GR_12525 [Methylobacterium oryzae CBMB20]
MDVEETRRDIGLAAGLRSPDRRDSEREAVLALVALGDLDVRQIPRADVDVPLVIRGRERVDGIADRYASWEAQQVDRFDRDSARADKLDLQRESRAKPSGHIMRGDR